MAEIVGVVAASLEFGKIMLELKQLASSIKHAPEELLEMLEELDLTDNILQTLADQDALLAIYAPPVVIQKCRDSCEKGVDILKPLCFELRKAIERSKLRGSIKSVLKENLLAKARRRIERAKINLILAQTAAANAINALNLQQHITTQTLIISGSAATLTQSNSNPEGHLYQSDGTLPILDNTPVLNGEGHVQKFVGSTRQERRTYCRQRLQSTSLLILHSSWLGKRVEFLRIRASGVPFFGIKTYNIIPYHSPVFTAVRAGDVAAIQSLFRDKSASIYDRDQFGNTLLMEACWTGQLSSMRFLLQQGADPNDKDFDQGSCLGALTFGRHLTRDTFLILAGNHDLEDLTDSTAMTLANIAILQQDGLPEIVPVLEPVWSNADFAVRLELAYSCCRPDYPARDFWLVLSEQRLDESCLTMPEETGNGYVRRPSLALYLASTMGRICTNLSGWRSILQQVVSLNGIKISFEHQCGSPMLEYLGFNLPLWYWGSRADLSPRRLTRKLQNWAHEMQLAGQDLQAYGRWEQEFLSNSDGEFSWYVESVTVRFVNFTYGPSPQDWQIWVSTSMDESAGEFWEAVEDGEPVLDVPGSWPTLDPEGTEYSIALLGHKFSRRRRRRFLRYLGLELEREEDVFGWPSTKDGMGRHVAKFKQTKARRRQHYLGNNIPPPCREFVS